ncbi:hypothetical protein [Thiofilum flexile]|uniref:hypothetical protein n=1 Tax=Thiofilum flexile TaxID=125627 RepID=UPI000360E6B6|nr:hypothetical protein [Thiofilum flexile]
MSSCTFESTQQTTPLGNATQLVSGTALMLAPETAKHVRTLGLAVPHFSARPHITVSIYSTETMAGCRGSAGTAFVPWSIEYVARGAAGGLDQIVIHAANTDIGQAFDADMVCSYMIVGAV